MDLSYLLGLPDGPLVINIATPGLLAYARAITGIAILYQPLRLLAATLPILAAPFPQFSQSTPLAALKLDVEQIVPLSPTPDYQKNVLDPLKAAEAADRAREAALADEQAQQATQAVQTAHVAPSASHESVRASIVKWATYYGVNSEWLLRVGYCESGLNQSAVNYNYYAGGGNPSGVFQFLPQTFYGNGGVDYSSADDQARVAAHMFSIGQWVQWECR